MSGTATNKHIKVETLARVEGEGAIHIRLQGDRVADVKVKIPEPPRLFEAFLQGRHFTEAPDITARICGICPVAYQMSAVHAIEGALGVKVDPAVRLLRRLLYCGEWIESHALHIFLLHGPDFLGFEDAIQMAAKHRDKVEMGLRLKKLGNHIMTIIGGREIHPVSVCVGGFTKAPAEADLRAVESELEWAIEAAAETVRWTAGLEFQDFEQDYEFVALSHPDEYAICEGRIASNRMPAIEAAAFETSFPEQHVRHSNALHSVARGRSSYLVGPLARFNLNFAQLTPRARQAAAEVDLKPPCRNPFRGIIVRAVELVFACEEALRLIRAYRRPDQPRVPAPARAGSGMAATEAPRGLLYHRYELDAQGLIKSARIMPPTAQNLKRIEDDLWRLADDIAYWPNEEATWRCEQAVRNYDPCISCATHFMKVHIEREP